MIFIIVNILDTYIGVVAAMTLPTLVSNHRNQQLLTALKRSYSLFGQALDIYQAETGERIKQGDLTDSELKPILMKYMKTIKDCGDGANDNGTSCIPNTGVEETNSKTYTTLNGKTIYLPNFDDGQFILNDGSLVLLENTNLENNGGKLFISVDVNGYKNRPNRLGQDLFMFQINEKGILRPMGVEGTEYFSDNDAYCSPTSSNNMNGAGCTYKALTDANYFKNLPK